MSAAMTAVATTEKAKSPAGGSLVKKLAAVMAAVSHVEKSGRNVAQGYDYATEADVLAAVRKGLAERHVMLIPSVDQLTWRQIQGKNGIVHIATAHMSFTAYDGETGEEMVVARTVGEGMDHGDKNCFKAMTGATKYALLKLFLIPTGDDPEADDVPQTKTAQQASARAAEVRATAAKPPKTANANGSNGHASPGGPLPTTLPNYGQAKGQPIASATAEQLRWYAEGCRKSLADPAKERWHDKERALLAAIEAELARQRGGQSGPPDEPPPHGDEDAPF